MASDIARIFVDTAGDLAVWRIRAALRFQTALLTILPPPARLIDNRTGFGNVGPWVCKNPPLAAQHLFAGAVIFIGLLIPDDCTDSKAPVRSRAFIPDGHVRLDALVPDQPSGHGGSAVRDIIYQTTRLNMPALLHSVKHDPRDQRQINSIRYIFQAMTDILKTEALVRADDWRMDCLAVVREARLSDWLIVAGFVRNLIWDHLHGKVVATPLNDVDVAIFDPTDLSPAMEQNIESFLRDRRPEVNWQVRNQARMHQRNGHAPYRNTTDAISYYPELATCIGMRLSEANEIEVVTPHGLEQNWSLSIAPNRKANYGYSVFRERIQNKRWLDTWPLLRMKDEFET